MVVLPSQNSPFSLPSFPMYSTGLYFDGGDPVTGPPCSEYSTSLVPVVLNHSPTESGPPGAVSEVGRLRYELVPL